jgi:hypothetical protein
MPRIESFDGIVVEFNAAIVDEAREVLPAGERVANGFGDFDLQFAKTSSDSGVLVPHGERSWSRLRNADQDQLRSPLAGSVRDMPHLKTNFRGKSGECRFK